MIETIKKQELFKECCYKEKPLVYLRALRIYGKNKKLSANTTFVEKNTQLKNICGWCERVINKDDFDYFAAYWPPHMWRPVHKKCKQPYKDYEAIECQKIDADCNDCKHFIRGRAIGNRTFMGWCNKFNKDTIANINYPNGLTCFEHRRV